MNGELSVFEQLSGFKGPDIAGELSVFEELSGVSYDTYNPFSGMTPSAIAGGYASNFPVEAYAEPEPDWLTSFSRPWVNLWETGAERVEYTAEKLPDLLFERSLQEIGILPKRRVVDEGAGVTVIHSQAPQTGGTPAQPTQVVIPGRQPSGTPMPGAPPQAVGTGTMILIGAGLIVLYILFR